MRRTPAKPQKSLGFTIGKWFLVAEGVLVAYAYSIYFKLNRYQDYRYKYHKEHPWILNMYYKVGETIGGLDTRNKDLEHWRRLESSENKS
ncbi:protein CEBPZOS-like [Mercenaria mercenaria]|uniref:protein CEBPZOS-like n=1 Tax=Mercenaria mercenaria TaxID=6596 RepID=UPI00234F232A|nr:protein CEBPZOS-like [Mercenaria mercenaria]